MQIFSNKTLNGRQILKISKLTLILSLIANWYEDRLVKDQLYKTKPELRIVWFSLYLVTRKNSSMIYFNVSNIPFIDQRERVRH